MRAIACAIISHYLLSLATTMANSMEYQLASNTNNMTGLVFFISFLFIVAAIILMLFGL